MMNICMFLILILYVNIHNGHIIPVNIRTNDMDVFEKDLQEILNDYYFQ